MPELVDGDRAVPRAPAAVRPAPPKRRRRARAEHRLRELVTRGFMDRLERSVLEPGRARRRWRRASRRARSIRTRAAAGLPRPARRVDEDDESGSRSRRHRRARSRGGAGVLSRRARPRGRSARGGGRRSACARTSFRSAASTLELLEATAADSAIARYVDKRGPGLHHITLRVEDIAAALAQLKARGVRLIDEQPRPGAEGALVAFIHPSSAHGVLVELKQPRQSEVSRSEIGNRAAHAWATSS